MERKHIDRLIAIVGKEYVLLSEEERICYSYDGTFKRGIPAVVVMPANTEETAAVVKYANEMQVPVCPRGAGTGLSGGSVPRDGGIALVLTRMNEIKEINKEDLLIVVGPGVVTGTLHSAVEEMGLFYPPDPASSAVCTIGGNIAENAGGPRAFKYGVTKDYVLGLEVVTPTGDIMRTGGRTVKNVTGYDLTRLLTGSEGTLGVVTEVTLRLIPKPKTKSTAMVAFDKLVDAARAITAIVSNGIIPVTMELMDDTTIRCVEANNKIGLPLDAEAILLIEVDGQADQVKTDIQDIAEICRKEGATKVEVATTKEDIDRLWKGRKAVSASVLQLGPTKISEDATIPRSKIPEMIMRLKEIAQKYDIKMPIYGHAGDGNLHPNIVADKDDPEEMARVAKATDEIFAAALALGGTLSGEHGIGLLKKDYMEMAYGKVGVDYLRAIKKAVDPNNILNPGKVF